MARHKPFAALRQEIDADPERRQRVEALTAKIEAGIDPSRLRANPNRARRVAAEITAVAQVLGDLAPHPWMAGQGGISCICSMAGRLIKDDYHSLAVIGFKDDPIHLQEVVEEDA